MVCVRSGGKVGPFQDLITLQKPIFLKVGNSQLTSMSSVSEDACVFPGDKNFFGSENVEYLPKLGFVHRKHASVSGLWCTLSL